MKRIALAIALMLTTAGLRAQIVESEERRNDRLDSLYIGEVEDRAGPEKVLHAEPLFIDLIRDLGARKGEKEWNLGAGITDNRRYDRYTAFVEYEWAPVNRLGFEVELPFSFYSATETGTNAPVSRLNSLKLAAQYSFFVSEKRATSMALGYIQELELPGFRQYRSSTLITGYVYNPFFVAAKRWGRNVHTLIYTGPQLFRHAGGHHSSVAWQANSNFHYMIDGTRNFVGVELNKELRNGDFDMTIRPQMRVSIKDNLLIGIVTGIPIRRENERFSSFLRLIYEPGHRKA